MDIGVYAEGRIEKVQSLGEALRLAVTRRFHCKKIFRVIAFTGAGGKTTLLYALAREEAAKGKHVLIMTTTHMYAPELPGLLQSETDEILYQMKQNRLVVAGKPDGKGKIGFIGQVIYDRVAPFADIVLVEADGSRRQPFKVSGPQEPVLPEHTDLVICAAGLSAAGKPLKEVCFRWERAAGLCRGMEEARLFQGEETILTVPLLARLWQQGCLKRIPPEIPVLPVLNQADTSERKEKAREIFSYMNTEGGLVTRCL